MAAQTGSISRLAIGDLQVSDLPSHLSRRKSFGEQMQQFGFDAVLARSSVRLPGFFCL